MALRLVDRYAGRVRAEGMFSNPHPAAVDYLIQMLHTGKLSRDHAILNWRSWLKNPNDDMIRFILKLRLITDCP